MSFVPKFFGKLTGAQDQADAARDAAQTQAAAADKGIAQQDRMFAAFQAALAPYQQAGLGSLGAQQNLLGLNGGVAQDAAINAISASPQFQAMQQQGNDALLSNASATGGLRGGNTQGALAQFNQSLLAQQIQQMYANLGGLTSLGQSSAAGVGNAGLSTGNNISQLLQQQGAATAGGQVAQGSVGRQGFGDMLSIVGAFTGAKKSGAF